MTLKFKTARFPFSQGHFPKTTQKKTIISLSFSYSSNMLGRALSHYYEKNCTLYDRIFLRKHKDIGKNSQKKLIIIGNGNYLTHKTHKKLMQKKYKIYLREKINA